MATQPETPKRKPNGHCDWCAADSNSQRVVDVDFTPLPGSVEDVLIDWRRAFDSIDIARCWLMYSLVKRPGGEEARAEKHLDKYCQWNHEWEDRIEEKEGELGCKDLVPQFRFDQYPLLTVEWVADAGIPPSRGRTTPSGVIEERLEFIRPRKTEWVWRNYIPAGRITVIAGDPGLGKSTVGIDIVCRISRCCDMPDGAPSRELGACAIATAEDDTAETIVPRVIAADGDRKIIRVIRKVAISGEYRFLSLPRDTQRVYEYIKSNNLKLFLIDPLNAFMGSTLDTYKDHDVRLALSPIEDIAEETGCAIGVISHLNKKEDAATLYRVGGSIGFIGAARSVLAVSRKENQDRLVLYSLKSNLSKRPPAMEYQIGGVKVDGISTSRIIWHGHSNFDPEKARRGNGPQMEKECFDFLKEIFRTESMVLATDIEKNAKDAGIPMVTLKRYKMEFRVGAVRQKDKWYWVEPEGGLKK